MAPMALFESTRGWLLYTGIGALWGDPNAFAWLFRSGSLRAQVAAGHSINFGYHMAMALTFYLFLVMNSKGSYLQMKLLWNFILCRIRSASFPSTLELQMKGPN